MRQSLPFANALLAGKEWHVMSVCHIPNAPMMDPTRIMETLPGASTHGSAGAREVRPMQLLPTTSSFALNLLLLAPAQLMLTAQKTLQLAMMMARVLHA